MNEASVFEKYAFSIFFILSFINLWPYLPSVSWIPETLSSIFLLFWILVQGFRNIKKPFLLDWQAGTLLGLGFLGLAYEGLKENTYHYWNLSWSYFFFLGFLYKVTVINDNDKADLQNKLLKAFLLIGIVQILFCTLSITGILNYYIHWSQDFPLFFPHLPKTDFVAGSVFQKNHLSSLLIIIAIVISFLSSQRKMKKYIAAILLGSSAFFLTEAASRLVIIQILSILILLLLRFITLKKQYSFLKQFSVFVTLVLSLQMIYYFTSEKTDHSAVQRLQSGSSSEYRWKLWSHSWELIKQKPFFGHGIGGFAEQRSHIQAFSPLENLSLSPDLYNHSHLWILQLLIDHGILIGGLLISLFIFLMGLSFKYAFKSEASWAIWLCAWVIFIHSFTEYPLWYLSFFMTLLFCLTLILPSQTKIQLPASWRWLLQITALALVVASSLTLYQYIQLVGAYYQKNIQLVLNVPGQKNPMLEPVADFYEFVMKTDINSSNLDKKLLLCEKVKKARPVEMVFFKCSIFYAYSNNIPKALEQLQSAYHIYPYSAHKMYQWLTHFPIERDSRLEVLKFRLQQMILTGT